MKRVIWVLGALLLVLSGYSQNKRLTYTEGATAGTVTESNLKIDANNIFNTSAFAQSINYWSKSGETYSLATSGVQRVLVDDRGVSLGVTNRYSRLNVLGGINADSLIINGYIFGYNMRGIFGSDAGGSYIGSLGGSTSTLATYIMAENAPIRFHNNGVERMRINSNGNVGIGTGSPSQILDVIGNVKASGNIFAQNSSTDGKINISSGNSTSSGYLEFIRPNGQRALYIGFVSNMGGIPYVAENGAFHSFEGGYVSVGSNQIKNLATGTAANDAVNLSQAQNASNITTGTLADARISTNIARVADIKTATYTGLTIPTQSTDYNLTFNWNSFNVHTYRVDGVNFTGTNILISGSSPVTGAIYNIIFRNCTGKNLVFSSKFLNFNDVALSTIVATSSERFQFVYNGTDYIRID